MKSIYHNAKQYAAQTFMTIEQAKVRCDFFLTMEKLVEPAKKCPKCGQHTLEIESGSYEENIPEYVYCENSEVPICVEGEAVTTDCGYTSEVRKEHQPLTSWFAFDEIFYMTCGIEKKGKAALSELSIYTSANTSWGDFVDESNQNLGKECV